MNTLSPREYQSAGCGLHAPAAPRPLIIIVGPDEDTRFMLRVLFDTWEYCVAEADSVEQCIILGRNCRPALIVVESFLPFTDSLEVLRRLRHNEELKNIPAIMLSGFSQDKYRHAAIRSGAAAFLAKPVDFDLLREYLVCLAGERKLQTKGEIPQTMNEQLFGIYELDNFGTVLYSRRRSDETEPPTVGSTMVGHNFFEKIGQNEDVEELRRHFKSFLSSQRPVESFIFEGKFNDTSIKARVLMTRGHETVNDSASSIVIMDIKQT